jgi:hypothetical protein
MRCRRRFQGIKRLKSWKRTMSSLGMIIYRVGVL